MPGTPEPVVGTDPLIGSVAVGLSGLVVGVFVYTASKWNVSAVGMTAVGAMGYGLFTAGLWMGVRLTVSHIALDPVGEPVQLAGLLFFAGGLVALQAVIPFFLFARFGYVAPMVGFTGISAFLFFVFLRVGGEMDPLALFGIGFAPVFLGLSFALAVLEAAVRRVVG